MKAIELIMQTRAEARLDLSDRVVLNPNSFGGDPERLADTFPSLQRRGGCGINKKARSLRSAADGVVSSAKLFRPEDFAGLFLRLRPIGLALRATPAAPFKGGFAIFSLMSRPPPFSRLFKEGNLRADSPLEFLTELYWG